MLCFACHWAGRGCMLGHASVGLRRVGARLQSLTPRACPAPLAGVVVGVVAHWWSQVDGDWRFDSRRSALIWSIDLIDNTNRSGSLEFVVPACDPEVFYPVEVGDRVVGCVCTVRVVVGGGGSG